MNITGIMDNITRHAQRAKNYLFEVGGNPSSVSDVMRHEDMICPSSGVTVTRY